MSSQPIAKILKNHTIESSAPCRVDSGGTWDIKTLSLPLEKIQPITLNMAISLRTHIQISAYKKDRVKIVSEGFSGNEDFPFAELPFNTPFGLFFAAISYFGIKGIEVHIKSDSPVKSALGGSSTALIALIKALSKLEHMSGQPKISSRDILHLGYQLEDAVSPGKCGIQDQAAAVYGGVNLWQWEFGNRKIPYKRNSILGSKQMERLSSHILVAFSGKSHVSSRINSGWVKDFLSGKTRSGWVEANRIVHRISNAIKKEEYNRAAKYLREEMALRREITPEALIPVTQKLIDQAETLDCGARFTGAGAGGSVWAIGNLNRINKLKETWGKTLSTVKGGKVLDCIIEKKGVH